MSSGRWQDVRVGKYHSLHDRNDRTDRNDKPTTNTQFKTVKPKVDAKLINPAKPVINPAKPVIKPAIIDHVNRDRVSLGVACCRYNGNRPEILLVCKRYTYAFHIFGHGKYNSGSNSELITLFNGMTVEEKLDILSLNFTHIWYRLWLNSSQRSANYFLAKNKFESTFVVDGGARLKKLIAKSSNAGKIWEIPKGRKKNKVEPDIHCAVREFYEETGIPKKNYKIFPWATRVYSFVDAGVRYTNHYYLAFTKHNIEPKVDFGMQDQVDEISDIKWMNIDEIRHIDDTGRLETFITPIFKFMKKHAKN